MPLERVLRVDQAGYGMLRDAIERLNPRDDDVAEVALLIAAINRVAEFAESLPCTCPPNAGPLSDWGVNPCARCAALGRVLDRHEEADFSDLLATSIEQEGADRG